MRILKQLLYGVFYLFVLTLISYGVYGIFLRPAPSCFDNKPNQNEEQVDCGGVCVPCALKFVKPITASVRSLDGPDFSNAIITFGNPNELYGASSFSYEISSDNFSFKSDSFIYPGEKNKVIVEPNLKRPSGSGKLIIAVGDFSWISAEDFKKPDVQIKNLKITQESGVAIVSGLSINNESFAIPEVLISALVRRKGDLVGASKTSYEIKSFEEKPFTINIPLNRSDYKTSDLAPEVVIGARK